MATSVPPGQGGCAPSIRPEDITGLILAGGQSLRMRGPDKAWMTLAGRALVAHVLARLEAQVGRIILSAPVHDPRYQGLGHPIVADRDAAKLGPLAGIAAGLAEAETPWVMVLPCDTPCLPLDLVARLAACAHRQQARAVVACVHAQRQATIALLRQDLASAARAALTQGTRKLGDWLQAVGAVELDFTEEAEAFMNINTPEQLAAAEAQRARMAAAPSTPEWHGPAPVLGIAALSGTGKTTLLEALIPRLCQAGLRVALVKHAHHDFDLDQPGKDSHRLRKAGASTVVIGSARRIASITELPLVGPAEHAPTPALQTLLARIDPDSTDLVLVEGYKHGPIPRLVLHRSASGNAALDVHAPGVVALVADQPLAGSAVPYLPIDELDAVADFVLAWRRSRLQERGGSAPVECDQDPEAMSCEAAVARIEAALLPVAGRELLPLRTALARVTATAIRAELPVPGFDNAAVDGYACRAADAEAGAELTLLGQSLAGRPADLDLTPGGCVRITTGARLPPGADCVLMQEQVERLDHGIRLDRGGKPGQNIRYAGEDIPAGCEVFPLGRMLKAADIGVLASLGLAEVVVKCRLRVAIFSTGNELQGLGRPLKAGAIYDSNRYSLQALLAEWPVEVLDFGPVDDEALAIRARMAEAAELADLLITTGGVSVGDADLIKPLLAELGEILFWKVAIKPGRPLVFGRIGTTHCMGLPGNPVAIQVCFRQFVVPALARLLGLPRPRPFQFSATCLSAVHKRPGRMEFQRGHLEQGPEGLQVTVCGDQGSHRLSSVSAANCYIVLPSPAGPSPAGTTVTVELL